MEGARTFCRLEARLEGVGRRLSGVLGPVGEVDGYPILRLAFGTGRPVFIGAGIHGEEPGGVEGTLLFLERDAAAFMDKVAFDVYPCLNPYGYDRHLRRNGRGLDPNRQFRDPDDPLSRTMRRSLAGKRYELALDIHEDEDFEGFYIYETVRGMPPFGPTIRDRMSRLGPPARAADEPVVQDGLVVQPWDRGGDPETFFREDAAWSLDYLLYGRHAPRVLTIETPGKMTIEQRARMQREGILAALEQLTDEERSQPREEKEGPGEGP